MSEAAANLFRSLDRELWVITARHADQASGLISTSVSQASIQAASPRLMVGLARQHLTGQLVEKAGVFTAHLIDASQHDWVKHFGTQTGRQTDKFSGMQLRTGVTGAPILTEARAWLECRIEASLDSGDRLWYLAEVVDAKWEAGFTPYTFQQFLKSADDDLKTLLKQQLEADSLKDAELVAAWKSRFSD